MLTLSGSLSRHPVSLGRAMHQAGYQALGLEHVYVPFAVEDLEGAIRGMRALGIRGLGISMPFKLEVIPLLDRLDPLAERIGAVNTVVNDGGVLSGHNTDAIGAARAVEERLPIAGCRVVVIGAGGAARAVAYGLLERGARVEIVNRTPEKAERLAADLSQSFPSLAAAGAAGLERLHALDGVDVVVNASSAGMREYGARSPVPEQALRPELTVMDIVYKPLETELLAAAARAGARTIDGGRMLLYQACRQFELYTGCPAPVEAMDAALQRAIA
jgi:shikimate dehydrogenase